MTRPRARKQASRNLAPSCGRGCTWRPHARSRYLPDGGEVREQGRVSRQPLAAVDRIDHEPDTERGQALQPEPGPHGPAIHPGFDRSCRAGRHAVSSASILWLIDTALMATVI